MPLYKLVIIPAIVVYLVQKFREAGLPAGKGRQRGNKGMDGAKNQSIKELVYEGILNDIIQGVYPANSILNERTLVEKYGVSKTPVREALVQLCGEGILKNIPRYGYQLPVITPSEINAIIEYRIVLETGALRKTMKIITREQIDKLNAHAKHAGFLVL